jgi:NTE family protein
LAWAVLALLLSGTAGIPVKPVLAQTDTLVTDQSVPRPRIGLVLAGGGARGGAHIGVLRVLEELRIPVDYIVGTSIGSIIGGLYATGLAPDQMSTELHRIDWNDLFNDAPPRQSQPLRRKEEDRLDLFQVDLGLTGRGLKVPTGLVAGQKLNFILRKLTLRATGIKDFDHLSIPFRAVATDLDSWEMVVLARGDLADAMRASMAIPAFFTPAHIDSLTLVDGGMVRNLPVDVAREMGAEVIIAVDIGTKPKPLEAEPSALDIAQRTLTMIAAANSRQSRTELTTRDVLIVPDLEGITTMDFPMMETAEVRGIAAAQAMSEQLQNLSVSEPEYVDFLSRHRVLPVDPATIIVDRITFTGNQRVPAEAIRRRIRSRPGDPLDMAELHDDLQRINQIGDFQLVDYRLHDEAGGTALAIEVEEKSWGPSYLRLGMRIEGNLDGEARFLLNGMHRLSYINRFGAEWRTFFSVGDILDIATEFYQPLGYAGSFFIAPRFRYLRDKGPAYINPTTEVLVDSHYLYLALDLGFRGGNNWEARFGALVGETKSKISLEPEDQETIADLGQWVGQVQFDRLDSVAFPRSGGYSEIRMDLGRAELGASDNFDRLCWAGLKPLSFGRNTVLGTIELGTDLNSDLPAYEEFTLGGLLRLSGFEPNRFRGDSLILTSLLYYHQIGSLPPFFGQGFFVGAGAEAGNTLPSGSEWQLSDFLVSSTFLVGLDSLLGPLHFAWGYAEGGHSTLYVTFGHIRPMLLCRDIRRR